MLLNILDLRVFSNEKAMDAVVLGILAAAVINTATGHDHHITVLADIEIIVHRFFQAACTENHRDMNALVFGPGFYMDIDSAAVGLGDDIDIGCGIAPGELAVGSEIIGSGWNLVQVCNLLDQPLLNSVQFHHVSLLLTAASGRRWQAPTVRSAPAGPPPACRVARSVRQPGPRSRRQSAESVPGGR